MIERPKWIGLRPMSVIMTSRAAKPMSLIASCLCLTMVQRHAAWATTEESRCPVIGSVYRPNPDDPTHSFVYRLKIEGTSLADDPTQSDQTWHFQLLDRHSKKKIADSILREGCPTGGLCTIIPPDGPTDDIYSVIVELTDKLRRVPDFSAPRVIILPGFEDMDWHIGHDLGADGSVYGKVVWTRVSCGR